MESHGDNDYRPRESFDMRRLEERARKMRAMGESQIAGGADGEPVLEQWKAENGMNVVHRPNDEQGILRVSVGGGIQGEDMNYCAFRGDRVLCAFMLDMAAHALRNPPT